MKNILLLTLVLVLSTNSLAQRNSAAKAAPGGGGQALPLASAFLGTWEWHSGTDVFRLVLTRDTSYPFPNGVLYSVILGRHSYVKNGVVIEETFTKSPNTPQAWSLLTIPREEWRLFMGFMDQKKDKRGKAEIIIDPATPNQMSFSLKEPTGTVSLNTEYVRGFTVPTTMTLTRVP
ncbi:DUF6705 family protein [Hymenobacter elongatus]|uniref:DUF6705 domain-containing protein n=1 Tax=Hymenobacter elongatus TaxID=877208 RepID=A0A4Z0PH14_9BACT|nr:DUF6705 family protein [Hymenobacter elongatus]TGE14385.1 hypothetical protein E5J99_16180 [Hymenobacter elongatus]